LHQKRKKPVKLQKGRRICGGKSRDNSLNNRLHFSFKKAAAFAAENQYEGSVTVDQGIASKRPPHLRRKIPSTAVYAGSNSAKLQKGRRICGGKSRQDLFF